MWCVAKRHSAARADQGRRSRRTAWRLQRRRPRFLARVAGLRRPRSCSADRGSSSSPGPPVPTRWEHGHEFEGALELLPRPGDGRRGRAPIAPRGSNSMPFAGVRPARRGTMLGQWEQVRAVGITVAGFERLTGTAVHPRPLSDAHVVVDRLLHRAVREPVPTYAASGSRPETGDQGGFESVNSRRPSASAMTARAARSRTRARAPRRPPASGPFGWQLGDPAADHLLDVRRHDVLDRRASGARARPAAA